MAAKRAVLLVGHGATPADLPPEVSSELRRLQARRPPQGTVEYLRLAELERKVRSWPRTPATDPYEAGLVSIAQALGRALKGRRVAWAFNEFCGPTVAEAVALLARDGVQEITVIPTMFTRGGVHSETEIPAILADLKRRHSGLKLRYAWPFPLPDIARFLAAQIRRARS